MAPENAVYKIVRQLLDMFVDNAISKVITKA